MNCACESARPRRKSTKSARAPNSRTSLILPPSENHSSANARLRRLASKFDACTTAPSRSPRAKADRARFGLGGKPESVESRWERRVAVGDVQGERDHADAARLSERRDPGARQRADYHGGASLHRGLVFGEDALGLGIGARHLQGLAVLREDERGLAAQAHRLGRS